MYRRVSSVMALSLGAFLMLSSLSSEASAQRFRLGPHLGYNFDVDDGFLGVDFWVEVVDIGSKVAMHINPAFHWYFVGDPVDLWGLDLNLPFTFETRRDIVRPYVAPGLGLFHVSIENTNADDTDIVFNLIGGALFLPDGVVNPYTYLRVYLADDSGAELAAGVLFHF